jgi:hypothetical protein
MYALACVAVILAVALPWLAARGTPVSPAGHGNLAVLGAVIISAAVFGVTGAGLGALLGSEVITIAGLLLYLYVAGPLLSRITTLGPVTARPPGHPLSRGAVPWARAASSRVAAAARAAAAAAGSWSIRADCPLPS